MRGHDGHVSANLHKYQQGGPVYRWLLGRVHDALYGLARRYRPLSVLDVGCGEGFILADFYRRDPGLRLTGVDLDAAALAYARRHHAHAATFQHADVLDLPFEDDSFDVVLCSEVLEHLDDPDHAVHELKRVARRGVVLSVPHEPYFAWLNDLGQTLGTAPDPEHVQFWTRGSFETFLRRHFAAPRTTTRHIFNLGTGRADRS